jgi:3',5'-cyclic AMP phosphodiesterase CpdA
MTRIIHFSDIHLFSAGAKWKPRDFLSKRVTGYVNNRYLPRGGRFKQAAHVLTKLVEDAYARQPDLVVFSGDATTLGTEEEFEEAASLLRVNQAGTPPAIAVPGNHDYYLPHRRDHGLFERHFAPWQQGERLDDNVYPFARRLGPLYIVAVNSCQWNRWSWDSTGRVGIDQLIRLERLLDSNAAQDKVKVMVTHYPLALANGKPERRHRRLRDLNDLLAVAQRGGVQLWLHGHRHDSYVVPATPERPLAALCVGSGTQHDHWSYGEYLFDNGHLLVKQLSYSPEGGKFQQVEKADLRLKLA